MATLYLANCSRQPHEFLYRVPGEDAMAMRRVLSARIEPGTQQRIYNEAPMAVLEAIIDQHRAYGVVPVDEVVRTKEFVGLCYSFDRPVDLERLKYAVDHNQGVLHDRGEQQRFDAGVAVDQALERQIGTPMREVDVEVIEEGDNPQTSVGMHISRVGEPVAGMREGRRRR